MSTPPLGSSKDQLDTPALCVDLDALESNVRTMVTACRQHDVAWRPHAKCHKSPEIAHRLIAAGACGITCAKLGEAEVMAVAGIRGILIANMIVGPQKLARLVELCRRAEPIVCLDHIDQAEPLSQAMAAAGQSVRTIIEIDVGLQRVGCAPGEST
ncbi:MAG: alanine racemase, partial [Pirellulales bacterium]